MESALASIPELRSKLLLNKLKFRRGGTGERERAHGTNKNGSPLY